MKRWFVLLGCFIGMSVAPPAILLQPMGLFMKPMNAAFGWSRVEFSIVLSAATLSNAIILPLAGYLVDRFGTRRVVAVGTLFGCGSYAALSVANSFGEFVAIILPTVMAGNLASYPAFMGLAQRWFDRRLGVALAVTSTGLAVGTAGFSYLIAVTIRLHGWRTAFLTAGIVALVIGLTNAFLLIHDNAGSMPKAERRDESIRTDHDMSLGAALRTRDFWLYTASFSLVVLALVGCNFHLPALLSDRGASATQIASIVAIGSTGSLLGRLFTGIMLDRFPLRVVAGFFFLGQAIGFLILLDGLRWIIPAAFLLGAVQGAEIDVMGYVIGRRFGRSAYARILGTCFAITLLGATVGPIVMAAILDRTKSYDLGLLLFPLFPLVAFGLLCQAKCSDWQPEMVATRQRS